MILFFISASNSGINAAEKLGFFSCSCCSSDSDDDYASPVARKSTNLIPPEVTRMSDTVAFVRVPLEDGEKSEQPSQDCGDMFVEEVGLSNPLAPIAIIRKIDMSTEDIKILIIEDNDLCARTLFRFCANLFKQENIIIAENGRIGVDLFQSFKPHIVFMDRNMPEKDGITATREIRSSQSNVGVVPIIICVSDDSTTSCVRDFLAAGIDDFCHKPIKATDFNGVITKYVKVAERLPGAVE